MKSGILSFDNAEGGVMYINVNHIVYFAFANDTTGTIINLTSGEKLTYPGTGADLNKIIEEAL